MLRLTQFLAFFCSFGLVISGDYKATFDVQLSENERGSFTILVHEDWAPLGAARFKELCEAKYFNEARFFRVIDNFMAQFGIAGDPEMSKIHRKKVLRDDPVLKSNKPGTLTFATSGKHTRSTQLFINFRDNGYLDKEGFTPIGETIEGFENVLKIYSGYKEKPDQGIAQNRGNDYLASEFPRLTFIRSIKIEDMPVEKAEEMDLFNREEKIETALQSDQQPVAFIYILLSVILLLLGFVGCMKFLTTKDTKHY